MSKVARRLAFWIVLVLSVDVLAQVPETPPPAAPDLRYEELVKRQRLLEEQIAALRALVVNPDEVKAGDSAHAPIAGLNETGVFIRDKRDWFVLFPKGRVQVDWYNF